MSQITITFKTITQVTFTETFDTAQTIADVKKKIAEERGDDFAVELQKLIYNGKILDDAATVGELGIEPSKFVVVMLARKKAPVADATPAAVPATETAPAAVPATAPAPAAAPASDLTADQTEKLNNVLGMGYTREQALHALQLAAWDANRAVNLLLSGSDDFDATVGGAAGAAELDEDVEEGGAADIGDLAAMPQFEELRNLIRSNPAALPELMREIAQSNPALMNAISQNQGAFLQMMSGAAGAQEGGAAAAGGGAGPQPVTIRLTPEEAEAIQRIKSMGLNVPDHLIIEAYLACDKNEELAVSYIMDAMDQFQE